MTIRQFVQDLMTDQETYDAPRYMTIAAADYNLKCYRGEGRKLPRGINPKNFADAWNDALPVDENFVQAEAQGIADQLPTSLSVYEALSILISNMKANGHLACIVYMDHFDIDFQNFRLIKYKADKVWKVRAIAP